MGGDNALLVLAVVGLPVAAFFLFFAPRFMILLVWPIVFCYPQNLLFGLLPWNAGLDDVYVIVVALRMLLPRSGHVQPLWAKSVVWLAMGMALMQIVADYTGALRYPTLLPAATKAALKSIIYVLFAISIALDVRSERDIYRHAVAFGLTVCLAFFLVLVCFFSPRLSRYWEVHEAGQEWKYEASASAEARAFGPYYGPQDIGIAAGVTVPVALGLLLTKPRRPVFMALAPAMLSLSLAALLVAKSRSGVVGLAGMFVVMTLFSNQRWFVIALEIVGALVVATALAGGQLLGAAEERFSLATLSRDLGTRMSIWRWVITHPSPWIVFFGEGTMANQMRLENLGGGPVYCTPHNGYLDMLFVWGLGGVMMFALLIRCAIKWARNVVRFESDSCARALAWGLLWSLVAEAGVALTTGPWYRPTYRMMVYFLLVVVCIRYMTLSRNRAAAARKAGGAERAPAAGATAGGDRLHAHTAYSRRADDTG